MRIELTSLVTGHIKYMVVSPSESGAGEENPVVLMETSLGNITIELDQAKAPITVKNFLSYVDEKFYDGTLFHRIYEGHFPYFGH